MPVATSKGVPVCAGRHAGPQRGHGVGGGAVHADLAVPVERHEGPLRVDDGVDHREVEVVALADGAPVLRRGAAHGIGADADSGGSDGIEVDHGRQGLEVGGEEVVSAHGLLGALVGNALDLLPPLPEQLVGAGRDHLRRVRVGGAARRRVVLEAAVTRRIVGRGDDDAVGQPRSGVAHAGAAPRPVGDEDRQGDGRRRRPRAPGVDPDVDAVGDEDLDRGLLGGFGQGVRIAADEERAVVSLGAAVVDDRLGRRRDMGFVESAVET